MCWATLRRLGLGVLLMGMGIQAAVAQQPDLSALIDEALANNPDLQVLKHRQEAFEARVPQAGALDDPVFRFEASNLPLNSFDYSSTPMSGNQFYLSQMVPLPGTLAAKERAARHASAAEEDLYLDRKAAIVNMVKQAYFSLAFLDRAIAVTEKNKTLLQDFVRIAQTKYAVGKGLQQDVLKAQVTQSGLEDRLINLKAMRKTAEARLNLVLNRVPQAPVGTPGEVTLSDFEMPVEQVQQIAIDNRPLLKAADESVKQGQAMEVAARRQLWPSVTLSLGYRQRALVPGDPVKGSDFLSFGLGLNVPVFQGRKQRRKIAEAQADVRMGQAQVVATRQNILFQVQTLCVDIAQHKDEAKLFETAILPQAQQSLNSALAGYQVDKVDFLTLLNNQITLFNYEIDAYRHITEHEQRLADLEAVVGKRLF